MNSFVIDCSTTMSLFLPDEREVNYTDIIFKQLKDNSCVVPSIWSYETTNVLLSCKKRNRLDDRQINDIANLINKLPIVIDNNNFAFIVKNVLDIAIDNELSIYDASYIELAKRLNCPLATLDKKLANIANKLSIHVICEV